MNILVTGSAGFIGTHLCTYLESSGHSIERYDIVTDERDTVADYERLENAFERNDAVIHLAAVADVWNEDRSELFNANILGVWNIAQASQNTNTEVIFTSSITARNPTNLYATTKAIGEAILHNTSIDADIKWVRLSNVVGSGTDKGQVAAMVDQAVNEGTIEVWGDGEIRRSYVSVETVCAELVSLLESQKSGLVCELGETTMTNYEMAEIIAEEMEEAPTITRVSKMPPSPKELVVPYHTDASVRQAVSQMIEKL